MYHHHQQPSYNPYAAPNPPQYAPQYGNWPEQSRQNNPMSPNTFSGSFHHQSSSNPQYHHHHYPQCQQQYQQYQQYPSQNHAYSPPPQRPMPTSYSQRRSSVQQRWDDYVASDECSESLQGGTINQVSSELEQRAIADERLGHLQQQSGVDTQHAQQAERDRRLKWAQEMIIQNPALCAEVYFAMSKRPGNGTAPPGGAAPSASRSNSNSSVNSANSSNSSSPT